MIKVAVIGAGGFVGSAFVRLLKNAHRQVQLTEVTRSTYGRNPGERHDIVIHCAANSKKYLAEERPLEEFDSSVGVVARSLLDYPADLHILISSVDVYADLTTPNTTAEHCTKTAIATSHYGFHKFLAEEVVRHHAPKWLVFRLAGMIGPGLKKNPVFDLLNQQPLRIHPDSRYQFLLTDDVADICWKITNAGTTNEVFNICGKGTVSLREIAALLGDRAPLPEPGNHSEPRVVDINTTKLHSRMDIPATLDSLREFFETHQST